MKDIKIEVEGDYISFLSGEMEMYGIELDKCSNSAQLLDWIFQLHNKSWVYPEIISEFLETIEKLCSSRLDNNAQGCFCPWGIDKEVNWKNDETI